MPDRLDTLQTKVLNWGNLFLVLVGFLFGLVVALYGLRDAQSERNVNWQTAVNSAADLLQMKPTSAGTMQWMMRRNELNNDSANRMRLENARRQIYIAKEYGAPDYMVDMLQLSYLMQFGDLDSAEKVLMQISGEKKKVEAFMIIAMFAANIKGSKELSERYFVKSELLFPYYVDTYLEHAMMLHSFNENGAAIAILEKVKKELGHSSKLSELFAHIYSENGQKEDAMRVFNEEILAGTATANIYNTLGVVQFDEGDYRSALQSFFKASRIEPENGQYHKNIALAYRKLGEDKNAEFQERLAKQDGEWAEFYMTDTPAPANVISN